MSNNINETELIKGIEILLNSELNKAVDKFGAFNNSHEGYAIIKEEFEEIEDEYIQSQLDINNLWNNIKNNNTTEQFTYALMLLTDAKRLAFEAIQTATMAKRFLTDLKSK